MTTLISHFYNEEKMLPWWLQHHLKLFDHGILIDHSSTDRSVEICRELAPHWKIITSRLTHFDAIATDFEVMNVEATVSGWKMVLNTTEFLVAPNMATTLADAEKSGVMALRTHGVIMVDLEPDADPDPTLPLLPQKPYGYLETGWRLWVVAGKRTKTTLRRRLIHRYEHGAYQPGRHKSFRLAKDAPPEWSTCWFGFSPWSPWFKARKGGIVDKISEKDLQAGFGGHHTKDMEKLDQQYRRRRLVASDLRGRLVR